MGRIGSVLVFEFVTGGGLAGLDLPESWLAEGRAMRRALVADFAGVPGLRVVQCLDARLIGEPAPPGVSTRIIADRAEFASIDSDRVVGIAPETDGALLDLARSSGGRWIGSTPSAIALAGDKGRLAHHFEALGIPTPPTRVVMQGDDPPTDWPGPIVVKPVDGAGAIGTFVVADGRSIPLEARRGAVVIQPYRSGEPMSATYLIDREGLATLLAVGRQRIVVDSAGRIAYNGGTLPVRPEGDLSAVEAAIGSVPGLLGLVGVDFLRDDRGSAVVLEINPRPTTSIVALSRLLPPGTIAGAWLDASERGLAGTDWIDRLGSARGSTPLTFDADGSTRPGR